MKILKVLIPGWMSIISFEDGTGPAMDFEGGDAAEAVTLFIEWEKKFIEGKFLLDTKAQQIDSLNDWVRYFNKYNQLGKTRSLLLMEDISR